MALPIDAQLRQAISCDLVHKTDFIPAETGIRELKLPLAVLSASPRLDDGLGACAGAVVSDSGHILTSGHCVTGCIPELENDFLFDFSHASAPRKDPSRCELKINGKLVSVRVIRARVCPPSDKGPWSTAKV